MDIKVNVKVKVGKEIIELDHDEAKELHQKLSEVFVKESAPSYPIWFRTCPMPYLWTTTIGTATVTYTANTA